MSVLWSLKRCPRFHVSSWNISRYYIKLEKKLCHQKSSNTQPASLSGGFRMSLCNTRSKTCFWKGPKSSNSWWIQILKTKVFWSSEGRISGVQILQQSNIHFLQVLEASVSLWSLSRRTNDNWGGVHKIIKIMKSWENWTILIQNETMKFVQYFMKLVSLPLEIHFWK